MNSLQESAWLAGLIEGEGSFGVYPSSTEPDRRLQLRVQLGMTDKDVVEHAIQIMPAGGICTYADKRPNKSVTYHVKWCGQKAENLIRRVLPYLGERRTAKALECLATPNLSHHTRLPA